jgi:hypothetical protein
MRFVMNNLWLKVFIGGLMLVISPSISWGHNPLSARYHLEAGAPASLLTINLSQSGINQALLKTHDPQELAGLDQQQLEELIVDYVKRNFSLSVNKQEVALQAGGIKLGSHQTDLKFVLASFPEQVERIDVNIPAFSENDNHQTIFSYSIAGKDEHVILSLDNDYQSSIIFQTPASSNSWLWIISLGLISLISIILLQGSFIKKHRFQL